MATTINSGYANSPKLTANIADHADVYGGRALVFDGVVDYLQLPNPILTTNHSISFWAYTTNSSDLLLTFSEEDSHADGVHIYLQNNEISYRVNSVLKTESSTYTNKWTHICCTYNGSTMNIYADGATLGSGTSNSTTLNVTTASRIGARNYSSAKYYFDGKMCDFKIFNSALTEAQVQELYKKPENTPSAIQDSLLAWYPMIEGGKPESPQSIVYDHSEKKLDSNILANGTFDTDISGWANSSPDTTSSTNFRTITHATIDGRTCIDINDQSFGGGGNRMHAYYDLGSSLLKFNTLYKISYYARKSQSDSTNKEYAVALGHQYIGITAGTVFKSVTEWDTWEYHELYIMSSTSNYRLQFLNTAFNNGIYNEHKGRLFLDDIKVQKVLMGNHATTNFFGDDLQTGTWNNNDPSSNGMQGFTGASADGFTAVNGASGAGDNDASYGDEISFTAGKTYQLSFTNTINSGTMPSLFVGVTSGTAGSADNIMSYATFSTAGNYSYTFTPSSTVTRRPSFRFVANGTYDFTISNFEVKEVGISSSGFETAVNEPVVPQVPLMRYNQAMYSTGTEWVQITTSDGINFGTPEFTLSFFVVLFKNAETWILGGDGTADAIRVDSNVTSRVLIRANSTSYVFSFPNMQKNEPYFFTITRASNGDVNVYRNGVKSVHTRNFTDNFLVAYIAGRGGINSWVGDILSNEFSIFNTHFSDAEAQELFNNGVALDATTHSKADDHLLGYWRNDGISSWVDRTKIQAISFDGTNDFITLPTSLAFALDDYPSGSYSLWFYANDQDPSGVQYVVGGRDGSSNTRVYAQLTSSGLSIVMGDASDSGNNYAYTAKQWNHLLVSWSSGTATVYINGVAQGNLVTFSASGGANSYEFVLGANHAGNSYFFNGLLGQFALWNIAQDSNASAIYALGRKGSLSAYSSGMKANYIMNPDHSTPDVTGSNGVKDRSGNDKHATITSATILGANNGTVSGSPDSITIREGLNSNRDGLGFYFTNPSSNVLRLNGIDEYLEIPDNKVFSFGDSNGDLPFSIEAWLKPNDVTGFAIISKGIYNTSAEYILWINHLDKLSFELYDESVSNNYILAQYNSGLASYEGSWFHVCATYDGRGGSSANAGIKLYINGSNVATTLANSGTYVSMENLNANVHVGRYDSYYADGMIDELRVYNKELSLAEIQKNYKHQKGKHKND